MRIALRALGAKNVSIRLLGVLAALTLATGACGFLAPDAGAPADTTLTVPVVGDQGPPPPEEATTPEPVPNQATDTGTQDQTTSARSPSIEERLDRILAAQEELARRVDSLAAAVTPDGAGDEDGNGNGNGSGDPGELLGQAAGEVRNFGVDVFWSVIVLAIFSLTIRGLVWLLDALAERSARSRLVYKRLVPIVRIVLWIFAAYLVVSVIFEVTPQNLFAAAAAIGVAVGFAAQDLLKNLFGGIILVFDQPFQVGDKITVGGTYGEVVSIGLRSTRLVTPDDNRVSVPNAEVVDNQVHNANAGELNCQVVTDLFLPGWADEVTAKRIAFDAAASSKYVYLNKPIVVLVSDVFKETFLTRVRVKAYVLDPRLEFLFQSDVTERAREGFRKAGLLRPENVRQDLVLRSAIGFEPDAPPDASSSSSDD